MVFMQGLSTSVSVFVRLLGGKHAEGFRKALSSDRINADAGGSGGRRMTRPLPSPGLEMK